MDMDQWARVRREVLGDGRSKRSVMSEEGLHRERPRMDIIEANGESYRLKDARKRGKKPKGGMIASRRGRLSSPHGLLAGPAAKSPREPHS